MKNVRCSWAATICGSWHTMYEVFKKQTIYTTLLKYKETLFKWCKCLQKYRVYNVLKNKILLININCKVLNKIMYIRPEFSCSKMQQLWHLFIHRCRNACMHRKLLWIVRWLKRHHFLRDISHVDRKRSLTGFSYSYKNPSTHLSISKQVATTCVLVNLRNITLFVKLCIYVLAQGIYLVIIHCKH